MDRTQQRADFAFRQHARAAVLRRDRARNDGVGGIDARELPRDQKREKPPCDIARVERHLRRAPTLDCVADRLDIFRRDLRDGFVPDRGEDVLVERALRRASILVGFTGHCRHHVELGAVAQHIDALFGAPVLSGYGHGRQALPDDFRILLRPGSSDAQ
jgi:hypothetical protein